MRLLQIGGRCCRASVVYVLRLLSESLLGSLRVALLQVSLRLLSVVSVGLFVVVRILGLSLGCHLGVQALFQMTQVHPALQHLAGFRFLLAQNESVCPLIEV